MKSSDGRVEDKRGTLHHVEMPIADWVYASFAAAFVTLLVLTNIIGPKLFALSLPEFLGGSLTLTAGIITYPITFLITDIVSEIYGRKRADRMVWTGFVMSALMLVLVQISIRLTPSEIWSSDSLKPYAEASGQPMPAVMQNAWYACFGVGAWLVAGSMLAYLVAQLCDNFLFHFWRRVTHGKHLWLRNNASTPVSQLVDTFIVNSFLFYGAFRMPLVDGLLIMKGIYLVKLAIAWLDTPFCYLGVWAARRFLGKRGAFGD